MTIVVAEGFVTKPGTHPQYNDVIKSISFNKKTALNNVSLLPLGSS